MSKTKANNQMSALAVMEIRNRFLSDECAQEERGFESLLVTRIALDLDHLARVRRDRERTGEGEPVMDSGGMVWRLVKVAINAVKPEPPVTSVESYKEAK